MPELKTSSLEAPSLTSPHSERGTVLLETSLAMTFLVFVFMSIFTIANMLLPYLKLTQVADEALRTLSAIPRLDPSEYESLFSDDSVFKTSETDRVTETCRLNPSSNTRCGHLLAKRRVQFLFQTLDINFIETSGVTILTSRDEASGTVRVRIRGPHRGLFMELFQGLPITVEAQGAYLF